MDVLYKSLKGLTSTKGGLNLSEMKKELGKIFPNDTDINLLTRDDLSKKYINILNSKYTGELNNKNYSIRGNTYNNSVILLIGLQGSTKSTYAKHLANIPNIFEISRDHLGGTYKSLVPLVRLALYSGKIVLLDNTNLTEASREIFNEFSPFYIYLESSMSDCQIRILTRMYEKYNTIFMDGKLPPNFEPDPNVFPPVVLFTAVKHLVVPSNNCLTVKVDKPTFNGKEKALFLDIDGTLRKTDHLIHKYPTNVKDIVPAFDLKNMKAILNDFINRGYKLIGISNQSGIAKGIITEKIAQDCFDKTCEMLNINFPILYCPHQSVPIVCYCRKPQTGNMVLACLKYNIDPEKSLFVGDMKTDQTTAERLSIPFIYADKFFI